MKWMFHRRDGVGGVHVIVVRGDHVGVDHVGVVHVVVSQSGHVTTGQ